MLKIVIQENGKGINLGELDEVRWRREIQTKMAELLEDHNVSEIIITRTGIPEPEPDEGKGIVCLTCRKKPNECECPDKDPEKPDEPKQK